MRNEMAALKADSERRKAEWDTASKTLHAEVAAVKTHYQAELEKVIGHDGKEVLDKLAAKHTQAINEMEVSARKWKADADNAAAKEIADAAAKARKHADEAIAAAVNDLEMLEVSPLTSS